MRYAPHISIKSSSETLFGTGISSARIGPRLFGCFNIAHIHVTDTSNGDRTRSNSGPGTGDFFGADGAQAVVLPGRNCTTVACSPPRGFWSPIAVAIWVPMRSELENLLMKARQDTARFCCGV
jgi:hypothetical protein